MASRRLPLIAFNRGLVDPLGLARQDVKRIAMAAEVFTNWMPRVLGSMMLRPGTLVQGLTNGGAEARWLEFIFSTSDKALVELTNQAMRVWVNDQVISRVAVAATVANGGFVGSLASWTSFDEAGATSVWNATANFGLELIGTGTNGAIREQQVVVAAPDIGKEHALRIIIPRGPVTVRVGSASGLDDYVRETDLNTGQHSLAFMPGASFYVRFLNRLNRATYVTSCQVEAAGAMVLTTPWPLASLDAVREDQSGDILFVACDGYQQRRIERRSTRSWSCAVYNVEDGPFRVRNVSAITLSCNALTSSGTLTASKPLFYATQVGALFSHTIQGQTKAKVMGAANDATASVKITGLTADRALTIVITGLTGTGNTVILQRSYDNTVWTAVPSETWAADVTTSYNDSLDNQIIYYRLLCSVYAAGATTATLTLPTGLTRGVVRIIGFTSSTSVTVDILTALGGTGTTDNWQEGQWSDYRGWPTSLCFKEGRLWWAGRDAVVGSVSDAFGSFDETVVGDSGPINRTIGGSQVDTINWMLPLQIMVAGGTGAEYSCMSTALVEPLTPTNFNIKRASGQGSAGVRAVAVDNQGVFVQRGGIKVFTLALGGGYQVFYNYSASDLSAIMPSIGAPGIKRIAVQRQPDTRVHCVRSDGTVAILVFDPNEEVSAWINFSMTYTDSAGAEHMFGYVEDVVVLPGDTGDTEDHVYYSVRIQVTGVDTRYLVRWATEAECQGGEINAQADMCVLYSGAPSTVITGLGHLEGQQVVVWADGEDIGTNDDWSLIYTVAGGQIVIPAPASNVVVGLPYTAPFKSGKLLELQMPDGGNLNHEKAIRNLGVIMANTHAKGLRYGPNFTLLYDLPQLERGFAIDPDAIRASYDEQPFEFPGEWDTDSRLCLVAQAPRPVTLLAATMGVEV